MNYFWLISNCSHSPVLPFSSFVSLFCCCLMLSVLLLPCSLLYTFNFCYNMCPQFCSVSFFHEFSLYCYRDAVCLLLIIFLFEVMLSCGIAIFLSSPTNNTFAKKVLIIFNIFTFFLFGLLSVLAWVFFNKNYFTVFNTELIKRFHRVRIVFWGDFYYLDKIYNFFYVLPFFDLVFQLLNRCSIYFNQHQLSYKFVRFHICSHLCLSLSIYLKSSFR